MMTKKSVYRGFLLFQGRRFFATLLLVGFALLMSACGGSAVQVTPTTVVLEQPTTLVEPTQTHSTAEPTKISTPTSLPTATPTKAPATVTPTPVPPTDTPKPEATATPKVETGQTINVAELEASGQWLVTYNSESQLFERIFADQTSQVTVKRDEQGNITAVKDQTGSWQESYTLKATKKVIGPLEWDYMESHDVQYSFEVKAFNTGKTTISPDLGAIINGTKYRAKLAEFLIPKDSGSKQFVRAWLWYDAVADDGSHLWTLGGVWKADVLTTVGIDELEELLHSNGGALSTVDPAYDFPQEFLDANKKKPEPRPSMALFSEAMNQQIIAGRKFGNCVKQVEQSMAGDTQHKKDRVYSQACLATLPTNEVLGRLSQIRIN